MFDQPVRFQLLEKFLHLPELTNADKAAMKLIVNPTDNTVTIEPWKDLPILKGGGTFDVEKHTFTIWYHYMENGKEYRTEATIVKNKS